MAKVKKCVLFFGLMVAVGRYPAASVSPIDSMQKVLDTVKGTDKIWTFLGMGEEYYSLNNYAGFIDALKCYNRALDEATRQKDERGKANAHLHIAQVYDALDFNLEEARKGYQAFNGFCLSQGDSNYVVRSYLNLLSILNKLKKFDEVRQVVAKLEKIAKATAEPRLSTRIWIECGYYLAEQGEYIRAAQFLPLIDTTQKITNSPLAYLNHLTLLQMNSMLLAGDTLKAIRLANLALSNASNAGDSMHFIEKLTDLHTAHRNYEQATAYSKMYREVSQKFRQVNFENNIAAMMGASGLLEARTAKAEAEEQHTITRTYLWFSLTGAVLLGLALFQLFRVNKKFKRTNTELSKANQEIALLLKEVNHRVKNNLQMVSSMLELEQYHLNDPKTLEVLDKAKSKITSLSLLHQNLYTHDVNLISLREYFPQLFNYLIFGSANTRQDIQPLFDIDDVSLNAERLSPLALMLCELVTNSLKYAVVDNAKPLLKLNIKQHHTKLVIAYTDNGPGLPASVDTENAWGMRLVKLFCKQIDARLSIDNTPGALTFTIDIPNT